jgi:putative ABC transport system substrate-binding protein
MPAVHAADPIAGTSMARIGYLTSQRPDFFFESFLARLKELGHVQGKSISIDQAHMDGRLDRAKNLVLDLAKLNPRVIVLPNVASMNAARELGLKLPFVVVSSVDPVAAGFAKTLSRPGGNFTGIANLQRHLSAKRLEVVHEVIPNISLIAVMWDKNGPGPKVAAAAYDKAAKVLKLRTQSFPISDPNVDLRLVFERAQAEKADVMVVVSNPMMSSRRPVIAALAKQHRMPLIGEHDYWADSGALLTFGANVPAIGERIADLVHRIVQGASPAELPFEQPTKFDLIVNLNVARALGITIPQAVLLRADRVIE